MPIVYLSLGTNLGNRAQHLIEAKSAIRQSIGKILAESSIHETEAVGFVGNPFYNQVIKVETVLSPEVLLLKTQEIEKKMGRTQKTVTQNEMPIYTNRTIDVDILLYDDFQIDTEKLTIPHPRMREREFVMKPLAEVQ